MRIQRELIEDKIFRITIIKIGIVPGIVNEFCVINGIPLNKVVDLYLKQINLSPKITQLRVNGFVIKEEDYEYCILESHDFILIEYENA